MYSRKKKTKKNIKLLIQNRKTNKIKKSKLIKNKRLKSVKGGHRSKKRKTKKRLNTEYPDKQYGGIIDYKNIILNEGKYEDNDSKPRNEQSIFKNVKKIIVFGDIHGDLDALVRCLKLSDCVKFGSELPNIEQRKNETNKIELMSNFLKKIEWIGRDTHIVQLGDQIDRARPEIEGSTDENSMFEILYLLQILDDEAKKEGGRVLSILGNHEMMNIQGDYRYVSDMEFESTSKKNNNSDNKSQKEREIEIIENRKKYFEPGNPIAKYYSRNRYGILQINDCLFVHGGLSIKFLNDFVKMNNINKINDKDRSDTDRNDKDRSDKDRNTIDIEYINKLINKYLLNDKKFTSKENKILELILGDYGIFWDRELSIINKNKSIDSKPDNCIDIEAYKPVYEVLKLFNDNTDTKSRNVYNIFVAHTVQNNLNMICYRKDNIKYLCARCDVGMSKAFGDKNNEKAEILSLEVKNDSNNQKNKKQFEHNKTNIDYTFKIIKKLKDN